MSRTEIHNLTPLAEAPLRELRCDGTPIDDFAALRNVPLKNLVCEFNPVQDAPFLSKMRSLETINGKPVAQVWTHAAPPAFDPQVVMHGYRGRVYSLAFLRESYLTSCGDEHVVRLWELRRGTARRPLSKSDWNVARLAVRGELLATGGTDRVVRLIRRRQVESLPAVDSPIEALAVSPDGRLVAIGTLEGTLLLWSVAAGQFQEIVPQAHVGPIHTVAFAPSGLKLATGGTDQRVHIWDAASGQHLQTLTGHAARVNCVAFAPQGNLLASAASDNTIRLWDAQSFKLAGTARLATPVFSLAWLPHHPMLAVGAERGVAFFDAPSLARRFDCPGSSTPVLAVAASADGRYLAAECGNVIKVWNLSKLLSHPR